MPGAQEPRREPGRVESFARGGLVFPVIDEGPLGGEPVVLLHGAPQAPDAWDAVVPGLHGAGYRTLRPVLRGYHRTARPRSRFAYRMSAAVADVAELVVGAGLGPVHLVAHDRGAAVGWRFAEARPELLKTFTAVSVPHPAVMATGGWYQYRRSWYKGMFQLPWLPERLFTNHSEDGWVWRFLERLGQTPERIRRDLGRIDSPEAARGVLGLYRGILFALPLYWWRKVSVPTLMIGSDGDAAVGEKTVERTGKWVAGPYAHEMLRGVSHWIPEEAPRRTAELILQHIANNA